ncbi:VOC family protein [Foetidibacter luteolus]|uniref:VOC family protein n=1 Tax=Foetidibacter luteolus TaxID=2608880 RepID=UPI00129C0B69|nr:VOC family protein [Foetidibacter luteolus]
MRFQKITLQTSRLTELHEFYSNVLGLYIHYRDDRSFELLTGASTLRFEVTDTGHPFYHFAWNIPENRYLQAADWLKQKNITLLTEPGTSNEILDFTDWNAHAMYFYDPAGNLVELIARHNLGNTSAEDFNPGSFLEISETGVVAKDYATTYSYITQTLQIPFWKGNHENFNALGDEHGLFITVPEERVWFMSDKKAQHFPLEVNYTQDGINKTVYF